MLAPLPGEALADSPCRAGGRSQCSPLLQHFSFLFPVRMHFCPHLLTADSRLLEDRGGAGISLHFWGNWVILCECHTPPTEDSAVLHRQDREPSSLEPLTCWVRKLTDAWVHLKHCCASSLGAEYRNPCFVLPPGGDFQHGVLQNHSKGYMERKACSGTPARCQCFTHHVSCPLDNNPGRWASPFPFYRLGNGGSEKCCNTTAQGRQK